MTAAVAARAASRTCSSAARWTHSVRTHLTLESSARGSQRISRDLFIHVHRLGVLPQVIKSGEAARAMTLKRTLASVFANMSSEVFTASEAQVAGRKVRAEEALSLLLLRRRRTARLALVVGIVFPFGIVVHVIVGRGSVPGVARRRCPRQAFVTGGHGSVRALIRDGRMFWGGRAPVRVGTGSCRTVHGVVLGGRVIDGEEGGHGGRQRWRRMSRISRVPERGGENHSYPPAVAKPTTRSTSL